MFYLLALALQNWGDFELNCTIFVQHRLSTYWSRPEITVIFFLLWPGQWTGHQCRKPQCIESSGRFLGKPQKNGFFLVAWPLRPYSPPSSLVAKNFQKTVFFLSGQALTPNPLLVTGPLKKIRFLRLHFLSLRIEFLYLEEFCRRASISLY